MANAHNDFLYIQGKVAHLKRAGLVGQKSTGVGFNGGAAPDWLIAEQKKQREHQGNRRVASFSQQSTTEDDAA